MNMSKSYRIALAVGMLLACGTLLGPLMGLPDRFASALWVPAAALLTTALVLKFVQQPKFPPIKPGTFPFRFPPIWPWVPGTPQPPPAPSLTTWLSNHPNVANNIKWQFVCQSNAYDVPETAKRAWPSWTTQEQAELVAAFEAEWRWRWGQPVSGPISASDEGLPYPPTNLEDTSADTGSPWTAISRAYARDLFVRWVAHTFVMEIGNHVPWSITTYSDEQLQVLLDSAAVMSCKPNGSYTLGGNPGHPNYVKRKNNLGAALIAPPRYTYAFLVNNQTIGASRIESIGRLLQWVSDNLAHFYGEFSYAETENHWQYRGCPPITRMIEGTRNPTLEEDGQFQHWTAGCHGTTGFLRNTLRAINIPVHISNICGHSQACFITEGVYLDHGDNPYNQIFRSLGRPASDLLIDHNTYVSRFGASTDNRTTGCNLVGSQISMLAP